GGDFLIDVTGGSAGTVTESGTVAGTYTFEVSKSDNVAGSVSVGVTVGGVALDDAPSITFTASAADAGDSEVTAESPVAVATSATVTVVVVDAYGNAVTGLSGGDFLIDVTGGSAGTVTESGTVGRSEERRVGKRVDVVERTELSRVKGR